MVWFIVFNATFNNISVISWRLGLLVEETGVPEDNHRPVARRWLFSFEKRKKNVKKLARSFNITLRYIYDVLSLNSTMFGEFVDRIYQTELEIKDTKYRRYHIAVKCQAMENTYFKNRSLIPTRN
jgi:hypothetical protein